MPKIWTWTLFRLGFALVAGALIGLIYDSPALGMLIVALAALGWHLYNLYRLERWLATGSIADIPDGEGAWPPVFARIQFIKTKAKRRGKRFRRLVKELRASTEAFPDGGVILNAQHEILNYNSAARLLLNLKARGDRGQRIENLLRHPDFVAYLRNPAERPVVEIPSPAGGDTWLSCRLIPYGPNQTLLLIRDISQRVKIERVRRDFVANASHELRTPLTVIMGYLDTLGDDPAKPSAWLQPVRVMQEQVQRMFRLVEDLLQLSKLESGQSVARDRVVSVSGLIEIARRDAQSLPGFCGQIEVQLNSAVNVLGKDRAAVRGVEPGSQCGALHSGGGQDHHQLECRPGGRPPGCRGHRYRYVRGRYSAGYRAFLPRRRRPRTAEWRYRSWPVDSQICAAQARCGSGDPQPAWSGQQLHLSLSPGPARAVLIVSAVVPTLRSKAMESESFSHHISRRFNAELEHLRSEVLHMGGLVEQHLDTAVEAITSGDSEMGLRVSSDDFKINRLEVSIDEECSKLLATRMPAAADLRLIVTVIKIITDLERVGDEASKIGYLASHLAADRELYASYSELKALGEHVQTMLHDALDAFSRMDVDDALAVIEEDKLVDEEYDQITRQCIALMMEDSRTIRRFMDVTWAARALERIGDHAKNIGEYVVYLVHGRDIRHTEREVVRQELDAARADRPAGT